jgi:lysophospholipase
LIPPVNGAKNKRAPARIATDLSPVTISTDTYASPAAAGLQICRHRFWPEGTPRGRVTILHGLGDHIGCHRAAAELFCARGYACTGVDWPGHGLSEGKRGHLPGLAVAFGLIEETQAWLDAETASVGEHILYAHSTGAFFALHWLDRIPIQQGMISDPTGYDRIWLGSPLLKPDQGQPRWLVRAAGWLAKIAPTLTIDTRVRPERARHVKDPAAPPDADEALCHHQVSTALGADILRHTPRTRDTARRLTDPLSLLITQGTEDTICPPEFSRAFFEAIPAKRKTYALLTGNRHETLREPDNSPVRDAVNRWLDEG